MFTRVAGEVIDVHPQAGHALAPSGRRAAQFGQLENCWTAMA